MALFSVFYNMLHTPPLNQACLRKIVPWLESQHSYVHAERSLVQKQTKAVFF